LTGENLYGPEESVRIQSNLASTIAMAFDECVKIRLNTITRRGQRENRPLAYSL
jgi:queuine/archaeosine tRNA-ribosyltransferase